MDRSLENESSRILKAKGISNGLRERLEDPTLMIIKAFSSAYTLQLPSSALKYRPTRTR